VKHRLYLDTSVFGGCYDEEFSEHTMPLFERIRTEEFVLLFSMVTQEELKDAPERVRTLITRISDNSIEIIDINAEAVDLANANIAEKVVGATSFADCLHIALATINRADHLVSWNFKHM
jgi:predicted nucleic acid-binding protein